MYSCHSILECYNLFSEVKLSMKFILHLDTTLADLSNALKMMISLLILETL